MRKSMMLLALLSASMIPTALFAAGTPEGASPAAAACPAGDSSTFLQSLAQAVPPASPKTTYTVGVCSNSCDPATCRKGPHGFCQTDTCWIGGPVVCQPGYTCLVSCDF
jgi:hypothetical protein